MITPDMIPALQGVVPSTMATATADGIPNITYISQVFFVDDTHVALSLQFLNKTWINLQQNPNTTLILTHPVTFKMWEIQLVYEEYLDSGALFDAMDMELTAIASLFEHSAHFKLKAALMCRVDQVKVLFDGC